MIKVWDWMAGTVGHEVRVFEAVEPFIKVGASKKRRKDPDGEDEIAETAEAGESSEQRVERPRGKKKKRKQKRAQQERTEDVEPENTPAPVPEAGPGEENVEHEDEIVLVLHKISSLAAARRVVFSAVGYAPSQISLFNPESHW
jgi:tRNA (guanine-N(7)-)-methyltransferase subunit TRM82